MAKAQPARPWLTVILDDYSRAIAGYRVELRRRPSVLQHRPGAARKRSGARVSPHWHVCGIPEVFYTDHGSDFTSQHLEQVAAGPQDAAGLLAAGEPRGRGRIERFFEPSTSCVSATCRATRRRVRPQPMPTL